LLPESTSILAGIKASVSDTTIVEYDEDGAFEDRSTVAPLGIAIVGEAPYAEGWGDREHPILYEADLNAIARLQESSERVVVVIVSGRPLLVSNEIAGWDAVVAAWLPGSEGMGVADGLFGRTPFSGTLPIPWPRTSEQLPISATGQTTDGSALLYPRGFGL
jgi:beta-glucosidase